MQNVFAQVAGVAVGELAGVTSDGRPMVRMDADSPPRPARVVWLAEEPDWGRAIGLRVVVAHEDGNEDLPIVLGLLDAPREPRRAPRSLRLESERELVIECGKAKIMLSADGRIEIRGGHLVSRSTGPNKIKGGTVHIN